MPAQSKNPADQIKYHVAQINEWNARLEEAVANLSAHSEALHRLTADVGQRLLTRG